VYPVDTRVGVRAGQLLGAVGAGSEHAVDAFVVAFVVAVGDLAGGSAVATVDPDDMNRLAAHATHVVTADLTAR